MERHYSSQLQELKHSDFHIVDEQPDIQGWSVYDSQHQKIGEVHDLLFDPEVRKVRYIITSLHKGVTDRDAALVLIPIGMAELHESEDEVILTTVTSAQLGMFSPYPYDALKNNAEQGDAIALDKHNGSYDHRSFSDENFYRNRQAASGSDAQSMPAFREQLRDDSMRGETGGIRLRSKVDNPSIDQAIRPDLSDVETRRLSDEDNRDV